MRKGHKMLGTLLAGLLLGGLFGLLIGKFLGQEINIGKESDKPKTLSTYRCLDCSSDIEEWEIEFHVKSGHKVLSLHTSNVILVGDPDITLVNAEHKVKNTGITDVFVRIKLDGLVAPEKINQDYWEVAEDGYIYYKRILGAGYTTEPFMETDAAINYTATAMTALTYQTSEYRTRWDTESGSINR